MPQFPEQLNFHFSVSVAAPRFELLKHVQKYDSYCIEYRITGHPTPSKTWYFNNTLLDFKKSNISDTVYPNTNSNKRNQFAVNGADRQEMSHFLILPLLKLA